MRYFSARCARMYRLRANSRSTISSTAIFLSQQSRQYFSSPRGSDTSLAPHSAHRDLTTDLRGIGQFTINNLQLTRRMSKRTETPMERPTHAGLRHLALNARDLAAMKQFYVDVLGFAVEWEPDADNIYLSSGIDNLALHRAPGHAVPPLDSDDLSSGARTAAADLGVSAGALDHIGLIVRSADDVDRWAAFL